MQRVVHQLELTVVEVSRPFGSRVTAVQAILHGATQHCAFPMETPLLFEEERLLGDDVMQLQLLSDSIEVGSVEFSVGDQFPTVLEGDFDMWFKVNTEGSPSKQQPRLRLAVSLKEVAAKRQRTSPRKRPDLPEGLPSCPRCEFLERLTASQQNELQCLAESVAVYKQVAAALEESEQGEVPAADVEALALELLKIFRNQSGGLAAQDADHVRMVLLGLNEKLKVLQVLQREVQSLRAQLEESQELRRTLEASITETTEELQSQSYKQSEEQSRLAAERQSAVEALRKQLLQFREKCTSEEQLQAQLALTQGQLAKAQAEQGNFIQMKAHLEALKAELKEAELQRQTLRQHLTRTTQDFEQRAKEAQTSHSRLLSEKLSLQTELDQVQTALLAQRADTDRATQEVLQLKGRLTQVEAQLAALNNQVRSVTEVRGLAERLQVSTQGLEAKLQDSASTFQRQLDELVTLNAKVRSSETRTQNEANQQATELQARTTEVQQLTREKLELTSNIATLEQMLCVQEDLSQMHETLTTQNEMNVAMKDQLLRELGAMAQSLLQQSERGLAANSLVTKLRELTEDKEFEIDILRRMVTELQRQHPTYIPVKDDPVDLAISEYCNARAKPLDVPFLREDQGIYVFGSKRVFIKMENGKIISEC